MNKLLPTLDKQLDTLKKIITKAEYKPKPDNQTNPEKDKTLPNIETLPKQR